ncbi:MAG: hypothetical protein ABIZ04_10385 [Opitutus sp.]
MFQPAAKLEFVRRYCSPRDGWRVFVDIDPSEEGNTGGERKTPETLDRQQRMREDAKRVRKELLELDVTVAGGRKAWFAGTALPPVVGDRDVIAFHSGRRLCVIAEVEGDSSGQPEQKLYKAIGQLVVAAGERAPENWQRYFALVVFGDRIARHLEKARALAKLHACGLQLAPDPEKDRWFFGTRWESRS